MVGVATREMDEVEREGESNAEDITIYLNRSANSDKADDLRNPVKMGSNTGHSV